MRLVLVQVCLLFLLHLHLLRLPLYGSVKHLNLRDIEQKGLHHIIDNLFVNGSLHLPRAVVDVTDNVEIVDGGLSRFAYAKSYVTMR